MQQNGTFTALEVEILRDQLFRCFYTNSHQAAELVLQFLGEHGYGVSMEAALVAVGHFEVAGGTLPVLRRELESLALAM